MSFETYLLYLGVIAAFFLTPPDTSQLLVISNSLRHGLRRSTATIAGDLIANIMQMLAAAFGLAAIIVASADALAIVKWMGVLYLLWIGLRVMLTRPRQGQVESAGDGRPSVLFRQGFLTSAANPYAIVFFAALFPQFLDSSRSLLPQLLVLGTTYLAVDAVLLVIWGWAAIRTVGRAGSRFGDIWMARISGGLLIGAAALLASEDLGDMVR